MTELSTPAAAPLGYDDLMGAPRRIRTERAVRWTLQGAALVSVLISAAIVVSLAGEAWNFISGVELSTLWADGWFPRRDQFDIKTLLVGTFLVTIIAMVVAAPLGLGAAIFLSEYASTRARKIIKPALEILAGIPSVVLGFFALSFVSPELVQRMVPSSSSFNLAAAGIGVGILVIPLVASIAEDAMSAIPSSLREASYGIGARKITTTVRVVVPGAVSGLVAAFIVSVSRAIGETMVVFIAAGASGGSLFSADPFQPGQTMTAAMASQASGTDQVAGADLAFQSLFFVGMLLFLMTFALNIVGDRFVRRVRQAY